MSRGKCIREDRVGCPVSQRELERFSDIDHIVPPNHEMLESIQRSYEGGTLSLSHRDKERLTLGLSRIALEEAS